MRLGCQSKGTEDFRRPADLGNIQRECDFFKPGNYQHEEAILVPGYSSLF